jgi:hypothetical protein
MEGAMFFEIFFAVFFGFLLALVVFKYRKAVFEGLMVMLGVAFLAVGYFYFLGQSGQRTSDVASRGTAAEASNQNFVLPIENHETYLHCYERWLKDQTIACVLP